jgi:hypothetical protein
MSIVSIPSTSGTPPRRSHAQRIAAARAARKACTPCSSAATASMVRHAVGTDATCPNNSAWPASAPRSDRQLPPSASSTATSRSTSPGACAERRWRRLAGRASNAAVNPERSANSNNARAPVWLTIPSPLQVIVVAIPGLLRCTRKVNPLIWIAFFGQTAFSQARGSLRSNLNRRQRSLLQHPG